MDWVDFSLELLQRLVQDWGPIRTRLSGGADPGRLVSVEGAGDAHRRGRTVAILRFSNGFTLVYKPRSQSIDAHFGELLAWMNRAGFETPFYVPTVIDRGDYGWSSSSPIGRAPTAPGSSASTGGLEATSRSSTH